MWQKKLWAQRKKERIQAKKVRQEKREDERERGGERSGKAKKIIRSSKSANIYPI